MELDSKDIQLLEILEENAKTPVQEIAEKTGIPSSTVHHRIKKLEDLDVILGYNVIVNPNNVGLDISAFITIISESSANYEQIVDYANQTNEIVECFATTGRGSHILLVQTQNSNSLEQLLRKIQSWPNVIRTETQIILSMNKNINTKHK